MALAGQGVLAIWNGIADEAEADFVAWHVREHIPERVAVPGFLRGRRYVAEAGAPEILQLLRNRDAGNASCAGLPGAPERAVGLDDGASCATSGTRRARSVRSSASLGTGDGAFVGTVRSDEPIQAQETSRDLSDRPSRSRRCAEPGIVAVHLLEGQADVGGQTAEKALRDGRTSRRPGSS